MTTINDLTLERWRLVLTELSTYLEDYEYFGLEQAKTLGKQLDTIIDDIYALQKQQSKQKEQNNDRH